MSTEKQPQSLMEAIRHFSDLDLCNDFVARLRWPNGPVCPRCGCTEHSYLSTRRVWKCKGCKKQYSVKVGTIFEGSPLGLDKWLPAVWLAANSKNGISSHELGRALGVTQKSAWFMLHRIRLAMQTGSFNKLGVEVDETFIGGKARNMHKSDRARKISGTGGKDKTAVLGMVERGGAVRAEVVPNVGVPRFSRESASSLSMARPSTPMRCSPTAALMPTSPMPRSIMLSATWMGGSTPTGSRTSGACSSAACTAPISASSHSTCSGIWTSACSPTTCATGAITVFEAVVRTTVGRRLTFAEVTGKN